MERLAASLSRAPRAQTIQLKRPGFSATVADQGAGSMRGPHLIGILLLTIITSHFDSEFPPFIPQKRSTAYLDTKSAGHCSIIIRVGAVETFPGLPRCGPMWYHSNRGVEGSCIDYYSNIVRSGAVLTFPNGSREGSPPPPSNPPIRSSL